MSPTAVTASRRLGVLRPSGRAALRAFGALMGRDLTVVRKQWIAFLLRTMMQPLLFVFVFAYVFPKIGQGIGGGGAAQAIFNTLLLPGLVASSMIFQGIQSVALPLVSEFSFTNEIEDRVMAPLPVWAVGAQKMVSGAIQGLIAAAVVFPLAYYVPEPRPVLAIHWLELLALVPLGTLLGAALGLVVGTRVDPRQISLVFSIIVLPMTLLGAVYYPWESLSAIPWLKWAVLINPLVYMTEGFRAAFTDLPHMPLWAIFLAMLGYGSLLAWLGIDGFRRRVLT